MNDYFVNPPPSEKFRNKYRISSARLKDYDYGQNGAYFVTICTKNWKRFFGNIVDDRAVSSKIGEIAKECWQAIPDHFSHVELGEYVIMPNHIHGIVFIVETPKLGVSTTTDGWKSGNLGVVINQYKRMCTILSRRTDIGFVWQSRFYDRIIRNEKELYRISEYIVNNPINWHNDDYFRE